MGIAAVVLTNNSGRSLEAALASISWCDEIIVIDDHSIDTSVAIAKKYNAKVYFRALSGDFSGQRNFGLEKANQEWALFVDSDEVVSSALKEEIELRIKSFSQVSGYYMKREDTMWGRQLKYGETGNIWLLRLAKKEAGKWIGKVHEIWEVAGQKGRLRNPLSHFPHPTVNDFLKNINSYSTIRARELHEQHIHVNFLDVVMYPKAKFFVNYFLKRGYKDGIPGFLVAILMSFHSFLVRGKLWQLQQAHK